MYSDPSGNMPEWAMWLIGGLLLVGSAILAFAIPSTAAGALFVIKEVAFAAFVSGLFGGFFGAISGGLTYDNGSVKWSWAGAASGFMWGTFIGVVTGCLGEGLGIAGQKLISMNLLSKFTATASQTLIKTASAVALSIWQGLDSGSLTLDDILLPAVFGLANSFYILFKNASEIFKKIIDFIFALGENVLGEIFECKQSETIQNHPHLKYLY